MIRFETAANRIPSIPLLPGLLIGIWIAAWFLYLFLSYSLQTSPGLCHIKAATGLPCPSCGGTRTTLNFFSGNWVEALYQNPLVFLFWMIAVPLCCMRFAFRRAVYLSLDRRGWQRVALLLLFLFLSNWIYVILK